MEPYPSAAQPLAPDAARAATGSYAGFWRRFAAVIVDGILVGIVASILASIIGEPTIDTAGELQFNPVENSLNTILFIVYEVVLMVRWNGQTLGKKLLNVRVVARNGQPLTAGTALVRSVMKLVSGFVLALGYLWMLWDPNKQTWHDKVANTVVTRE